jgi:hypothetical protein
LIIFHALEQDVAVQKIGFPALEKGLIAKGMVIDYGWMKGPHVYAIRSGHLLALTASTGNDECRVVDPDFIVWAYSPDIHRLGSWICDIGH